MSRKTVVVKIGGRLLNAGVLEDLVEDVRLLLEDCRLTFVHGGGDIVSQISSRLGKEPRFVTSPNGFRSRYTDKETVQIYTMVMAGKINKEIVRVLQNHGIPAVGLSGVDAGLARAKRKEKLVIVDERNRRMLVDGGYTGQIEEVNRDFLDILVGHGYVPVISSVATGENGELLNVDGDRMAAAVASSLKADTLVLLTDVEGVYARERLVKKIDLHEARKLIDTLGPGMITKVYAAVEAIERGVREVIIASGSEDSSLSSAIAKRTGTVIRSG